MSREQELTMLPQAGQRVRFEKIGSSTTRAHGVAHSRMHYQLARAEYLSKRGLWLMMALATTGAPVVVVLFGAAPFTAETLQYLLYGLAFSVAMGVGCFVVFGVAVLYLAGPRSWFLKLPVGTPICAEFTPDSVGIGWRGHFNTVFLDQIVQVRHIASVLVVQGLGDVELLIPDELAPPEVAAGLVSSYGTRRLPAPLSPSGPQHAAPDGPLGLGSDGVTRTAAIADEGLADRLSSAVRRSLMTRLTLVVVVLVAVLVLGYSYVDNGGLTWTSVLSAAALLAAGTGTIGYVVCIATPTRFRQLVPPGAPIAAEFGPQHISLRLGGHRQSVDLGAIEHIWYADQVFHVAVRSLGAGLVIPEQLVPPEVVSGLFVHFGAP
ncbi:MAG: hypothetical protein WBB05_02775 [Mycolicibacterium fortuitum]|uniref:hypothetical protein n=2 Tax=Mycobacteriaceae TaxID=1762 RepID=UPI0007EC2292|nr:hypothetical protein [Mycolicibacterium fortuitum]MCA4755686.1 hypothetical protein [Mycolicibacterium fortuitum]OBA96809.1 hypothetical protein A5668_04740 [Mycolicibacterium fortuitum]OBI68420.1 hypothetical protein A5666_27745 [Mycolicibacterium fortuitum]